MDRGVRLCGATGVILQQRPIAWQPQMPVVPQEEWPVETVRCQVSHSDVHNCIDILGHPKAKRHMCGCGWLWGDP